MNVMTNTRVGFDKLFVNQTFTRTDASPVVHMSLHCL